MATNIDDSPISSRYITHITPNYAGGRDAGGGPRVGHVAERKRLQLSLMASTWCPYKLHIAPGTAAGTTRRDGKDINVIQLVDV